MVNGNSCSAAPYMTRAVTLNCSQPDAKSLYVEIQRTFYLSAIRPVYSLKTPTNVTVSFMLYSILGVVSEMHNCLILNWKLPVAPSSIHVYFSSAWLKRNTSGLTL